MPGEKTPLVGFAGEDNQKRKKGHGITCLLIILFVLLLIFVALSATFISLYVINSRVTEPCITSTCISLTQEVLGSIDESVSPCNDFYNFACGGWERTHALEPGTRKGAALCSMCEPHVMSLVVLCNTVL